MLTGFKKDLKTQFHIVGTSDSKKFGKFLKNAEKQGKIKRIPFSEFYEMLDKEYSFLQEEDDE